MQNRQPEIASSLLSFHPDAERSSQLYRHSRARGSAGTRPGSSPPSSCTFKFFFHINPLALKPVTPVSHTKTNSTMIYSFSPMPHWQGPWGTVGSFLPDTQKDPTLLALQRKFGKQTAFSAQNRLFRMIDQVPGIRDSRVSGSNRRAVPATLPSSGEDQTHRSRNPSKHPGAWVWELQFLKTWEVTVGGRQLQPGECKPQTALLLQGAEKWEQNRIA